MPGALFYGEILFHISGSFVVSHLTMLSTSQASLSQVPV